MEDRIPVIPPAGLTSFEDLPETFEMSGAVMTPPEDTDDEEHGGGGGDFALATPPPSPFTADDYELNIVDGIEDEGLVNTNPNLVRAAKVICKRMNDMGFDVSITGGARTKEHNAEVDGDKNSKHLSGNALDMYADNVPDGLMERMAEELGLWGFWHDAGSGMHFHLQNDEGDEYDGTSGGGSFISALYNVVSPERKAQYDNRNAFPEEALDLKVEQETKEYSWLDTIKLAAENVWDSASTTAFADLMKLGYADMFHTHSLFARRPVTDEDIEVIKQILPNDTDAQEFCIMHATDGESARWLAKQKAIEKERAIEREAFYASNGRMSAKGMLMMTGGGLGMLADPINLIPMMNSVKALSFAEKVGSAAIFNYGKLNWIAKQGTMLAIRGGEQALVQYFDDTLRERFGGEKVDYAHNAAFAFLGGAILHTLGNAVGGGTVSTAERKAADALETSAMKNGLIPETHTAATGLRRAIGDDGYKTVESYVNKEIAKTGSVFNKLSEELGTKDVDKILSEAINRDVLPNRLLGILTIKMKKAGVKGVMEFDDAKKWLKSHDLEHNTISAGAAGEETLQYAKMIHDDALMKKYNLSALDKLHANGRLIVTSYEKASALVEKMTGRKIPESAKAFYVPNEDYVMLLADKVSPAEIEGIIGHEFAIHAGLQKTLGRENYAKLMSKVHEMANTEGTKAFEIRNRIASHDTEEILAKMVEEGALPDDMLADIKAAFGKALGKEKTELTAKDIKEIMEQQIQKQREDALDLHFNEDGTTAFAGVQFSKESFANANIWSDMYALESDVVRETQTGAFNKILDKMPDIIANPTRAFLEKLEQGYFGTFYTSKSNTLRGLASKLMEDARGRGSMIENAMPADTHKAMIKGQLIAPYHKFLDIREKALGKWDEAFSQAKAMDFNRQVMQYINAKAGNVAGGIKMESFSPEVKEAAAVIEDMYKKLQIDIGKRSAEMVGASASKNLIEKDWYSVDDEIWRQIDPHMQKKLLNMCASADDIAVLREHLKIYAKKYANREKVRAQLERAEKMEEARSIRRKDEKPYVKKEITDEMVEENINERAEGWAIDALGDGGFVQSMIDETHVGREQLGSLPFLKERLPMDTTGVMKFNINGNRFDFSFDNNLRSWDLDRIIQCNAERFAGEAAVKAVFGTRQIMESAIAKVKQELKTAAATGHSKNDDMQSVQLLQECINELRGVRPREDVMTKFDAICKACMNMSYAKNGGNMMFAQLAETTGIMAYGGFRHMLDAFKPLKNFMFDLKEGKISGETFRDIEMHIFGAEQEHKIFGQSYGDMAVRENLNDGTLFSNVLIKANDAAVTLGKITSLVNRLPQMTENMVRGIRSQAISDMVRAAHGENVGSMLRNPFSEAKLKASRITSSDLKDIQGAIRTYTVKDAAGNYLSLDIHAWQNADPWSYAKFYNYVELQAERAIVSGGRIGNRNLLKNMNSMTRMFFQFKDYTMRAVNAQTLRAMTAGDIDDAMAAGMSIISNTMMYGARCALTYQMMKAAGLDERAEQYYERMFADEALGRAIAFRSSIVGSPLSMVNDIYEIANPDAATIRTSTDAGTRISKQQNKDTNYDDAVQGFFGRAIGQLPAVKEATAIPLGAMQAVVNIGAGEASQKDIRNLLNVVPLPRTIPTNILYSWLVENSGLPKKKPKKQE